MKEEERVVERRSKEEDKEQQVFSVAAPGLIGVYRGEEFDIIRKVEKH